jgi:hypothetical protein
MAGGFAFTRICVFLDRPLAGFDNEQIFRRIDSLPHDVTLFLEDVDEECRYPVSLLTKTPSQVKVWKFPAPMQWRSFYFSCPDKIVCIQERYGELCDMVENIPEQYGAVEALEIKSVEVSCQKISAALIVAMERLVSITFNTRCIISNISLRTFSMIMERSFGRGGLLHIQYYAGTGDTLIEYSNQILQIRGWGAKDVFESVVCQELLCFLHSFFRYYAHL